MVLGEIVEGEGEEEEEGDGGQEEEEDSTIHHHHTLPHQNQILTLLAHQILGDQDSGQVWDWEV